MTATGKHLHFDCYCGISGDMTLGALVDLGVPVESLERGLSKLPIGKFALVARKIKRQGIIATQVDVQVQEEHAHRHLKHIYEIVDKAGLPPRVVERAKVAYRKLAEAEAHVHDSTPEKIHFHEVGAKDAIVDVAGAMLGFELLGIESFSAGPVVVGGGTVKCAHGVMPVPAPATAELLKGMPHRAGAWEFEMATPTGVAILATVLGEGGRPLGEGFVGPETALIGEKIGYGAGTRIIEGCPNFLRLMLCTGIERGGSKGSQASQDSAPSVNLPIERDQVLALECEIDDMSPEVAGYVMEQLFGAGALDVQFSPVQMKKNRPGLRLRVLGAPGEEAKIVELILRETSTFGLRREVLDRWILPRRMETIETAHGTVQVKVGLWGDAPLKMTPEFESCRALAEATGKPLQTIYEAALAALKPS